jgi:integrase/recombinase XerD
MNSRAKRVRVRGPLGPYSEGFRMELAARGYEPSSAAGQLQVMAHLSRWPVDRGLDGHELTSSVVEEFLRARRVAGYGQWLSARGMAPLLDHLREVGIAPVCSPGVADSVVEVLLATYRAYLVEERGLTASTVRNYVDVARQFLSEYCASGCRAPAAPVTTATLPSNEITPPTVDLLYYSVEGVDGRPPRPRGLVEPRQIIR